MAVLGSLTLLAVMASFRVAGLRSLERKTPGLIREMNETLGSTAALAGAGRLVTRVCSGRGAALG